MPTTDGVKNNPKNVSTTRGVKGGYMFVAPEGTEVPTDIKTPLSASFKNAGFVSSDGWTESLDSDSDNIQDLNGDIVDSYESSNTETIALTLIEMGQEALAIQYGYRNVTDENGIITVDHNWGNAGETLAVVLELVLKNGRRWRKVIPACKKTELGEFEGNATTAAGREITLTYQTDANGSGCKDYIESNETTAPIEESLDPSESWTVEQLRTYAAEHDIDLTGKTTKADILAAINAAEENE